LAISGIAIEALKHAEFQKLRLSHMALHGLEVDFEGTKAFHSTSVVLLEEVLYAPVLEI
jgi:hypothetical protein